MDKEKILEQLDKYLKGSSRKASDMAVTNFKIGGLISEACAEKGEGEIKAIAALFSQKGIPVSEGFLFDAYRVFRSIKSEKTLWAIKYRMGGKLNWWYLVNKCTRQPMGDTEEAENYWERVLSHIENNFEEADRLRDICDTLTDKAFNEVDKIKAIFDTLPESIRAQIEGLLLSVGASRLPVSDKTAKPLKIAHIADVHVSERLTTAGRLVIDPATGKNERLLDIQRCLSFAVDEAINEGCTLALITEPFESCNPTPNELGVFQAQVLKLAQHMPVVIEPGNHGLSKNPKDASALESLKGRGNVFVVEKPAVFYYDGISLETTPSPAFGQIGSAKLFVLPFPNRNGHTAGKSIQEVNQIVSSLLKLQALKFKSELDLNVPNVLLCHLTVPGAMGAENPEMTKYDPHLYPEDLDGFDYVALGHIHAYQMITKNICYAGNPERTDFDEEDMPKGFVTVSFDGRTPLPEFIETPAREFRTITPEFFAGENWQGMMVPGTIYRIKGEVTMEEREALKPLIAEFMQKTPLLYKLTVHKDVRVRDEKMTEDLKEEDALVRFLEVKGIEGDDLRMCLEFHNLQIKGGDIKNDTGKLEPAELSLS